MMEINAPAERTGRTTTRRALVSFLFLTALSSAIIAEEKVPAKGFYDSYAFSPQVIRSVWIDLDKAATTDTGTYTQYLHLSGLVSYKRLAEWAGTPIFISGPHTKDRLNVSSRTDFGRYNRTFLVWAKNNLIPAANDEGFRTTTQFSYDFYLRERVRAYYRSYCDMRSQQQAADALMNMYKEAIASREYYYFEEDFDSKSSTMTLRYPDSAPGNTGLQFKNVSISFSKFMSKYHVLFWLRRTMDGTAAEFVLCLEKLLSVYDREFLAQAKSAATK